MNRTVSHLLVAAFLASLSMLTGCSASTSPNLTGGTGGLVLVPHTIDFGSVPNGQTVDTSINLFNESADTITITSNGLSSPAVTDTNFSHPIVLAPDGSRNIEVGFAPSAQNSTGMDSIHYRSGGSSYVALLTLKANPSGTTGSSGSLFVPTKIDFGSLSVGQWHDTSVVIANTGSTPITIVSSFVSSSEARDTNFLQPITISGGSYAMIHLEFNPAQAGFRTAVDSIRYMSGSTSHSAGIILTATGVAGSKTPGPGSTYTYSVDTSGVHLSQPSTYTIVSNSLFYQGKSNVVEVRDDTGGIEYYHIESNGDLSIFIDFNALAALPIPLPTAWLVIPIGSKSTTTGILYDTTVQYQGFPVTIQILDTGKYVGPSQVLAAGKTFATEQGSIAVALTASSFSFTVASSETTVNLWYSNALAFYPKRHEVAVTNGSALGLPSGTRTTNYILSSYSIK
jgi:hypothetical protein